MIGRGRVLVSTTKIAGILIIEPVVHEDTRGEFFETYHADRYRKAGIDQCFVQDNCSQSKRGTLRGLHYQDPFPQGKLVGVTEGEIFDVVVDLRQGSPTYSKWFGLSLSRANRKQLYVPPGFAHGFVVTSHSAQVAYKCTDFYRPDCQKRIRWSDPDINIVWPIDDPILSEQDAGAQVLAEVKSEVARKSG